MTSHLGFSIVSAVLLVIAVFAPTPAGADDLKHHHRSRQIPCADLPNLNLPDTTIMSAEEVPAGPFPFGNVAPTCSSDIASPQLPAFCRVQGMIGPVQIKFEVWLPLEGWNGKFEGLGNHGFAGNIEYSDMGPELVKGYAVAGTDTGHGRQRSSPLDAE
jgi:feruloyl esterase